MQYIEYESEITDLKSNCITWSGICSATKLDEQNSVMSEINPREVTSIV